MSRYPFALCALLLSSALSAHAASFDCQKSTSSVEKALCASKALSQADETNAEYYQQLMSLSAPAARLELRNAQRGWLKQRNACGQDPASLTSCLDQQMGQRNQQLLSQLGQALKVFDSAIAAIPASPAQSAATLRQFTHPEAAAWLVYLHQFEPASGVTRQEADSAQQRADSSLKHEDDYAWSVLQDVRKDSKASEPDKVLMQLRMAIEHNPYYYQNGPDGKSRDALHCFVFSRQGDAAYNAFGPLYGSTRDGFAPICPPQGNLFASAAWKQLANQLAAPEEIVSADAGTMRYASFAAWRILQLRATLTPKDFLNGAQQEDPQQRIRDWTDEKSWPGAQRQQTLAAIAPAETATAQWLQQERGFAADDAQRAARHIVRAWLNEHLDYLVDNGNGE